MNNSTLEKLIELRKAIHQFPEVSGNEIKTAERILQFLNTCNPDEIINRIGGQGIVAIFKGREEGNRLMFRSELDALPIQEVNSFEHKSEFEGVGHKCGHDGHLATLCGVAEYLKNNRNFKGEVLLLFQPAEEIGEGAKAMLSDSRIDKLVPNYIFALHNLPGYPLNQIVCKSGAFSAAVETLIIDLNGKTAHAAEPEKGINPALAMADIIQKAEVFQSYEPDKDLYTLITPVHFVLGSHAYGTSAGEAHMAFTIRSDNNNQKEFISKTLEQLIKEIAIKHQLEVKIDRTEVFSAIENDEEMKNCIQQIATDQGLNYVEKNRPFRWGEDFGLFTDRFKGAMFGLGAGENLPALHNPDYDFPDEIIPTGTNMFISLINHLLK